MEYVFTLKYRLANEDCDVDTLVERLAEAGCDDALIGIGQPRRLALEFTREAPDAATAIHSALGQVRGAVPSATLVEAAPDLVGLTDVAEIIGVSRQNMRKLMLAHPDSFPVPVHEGSTTVWYLGDLLAWLDAKGGYAVPQEALEVTLANMQVNLAKEGRRRQRSEPKALETLV